MLAFSQIDLTVRLQAWVSQQMTFHMLIQVAFLCESQFAVLLHCVWARVGTFIRVDPQMIVEIVPLPEVHWAVGEIALQDFEVSLSLWVLELEYPKLLGGGNVRVRLLLINF